MFKQESPRVLMTWCTDVNNGIPFDFRTIKCVCAESGKPCRDNISWFWLIGLTEISLGSIYTLGTLMTSAAADVFNHNGRKIGRFKPRRFWKHAWINLEFCIMTVLNILSAVQKGLVLMFCWTRDITVWKSAWMTSAQFMEPTSSLALSRRHPCRFSNRYISLPTQR